MLRTAACLGLGCRESTEKHEDCWGWGVDPADCLTQTSEETQETSESPFLTVTHINVHCMP